VGQAEVAPSHRRSSSSFGPSCRTPAAHQRLSLASERCRAYLSLHRNSYALSTAPPPAARTSFGTTAPQPPLLSPSTTRAHRLSKRHRASVCRPFHPHGCSSTLPEQSIATPPPFSPTGEPLPPQDHKMGAPSPPPPDGALARAFSLLVELPTDRPLLPAQPSAMAPGQSYRGLSFLAGPVA
jgi:hypothetical protein